MKKLLSFFLALLATTTLWAYDFQSGDLYYDIISNNEPYTVEVASNDGQHSGDITIPETVDYNGITYSVTRIGNGAFYYCSGLTSIIIPESVTSIGEWAFADCDSLISITIPNSVTSIEELAFYDCSALTSITLPNSITSIGYDAFYKTGLYNDDSYWEDGVLYIGNYLIRAKKTIEGIYNIRENTLIISTEAFKECGLLTSIMIPNSVIGIGEHAFENCYGLTSVRIPNSVKVIGTGAFNYCSLLASVTLEDGVTTIGNGAFSSCVSLSAIAIPNSITSIGEGAFEGCLSVATITIDTGNAHYDSRNNCNAIIETHSNTLIKGCDNTVIPNDITSISKNAFAACYNLTSVTIPNSVTSIGEGAFMHCGITSINIPNSVTSIEKETFLGCSRLTSIIIPNNLTSIGEMAFASCEMLPSITIPNNVERIGESAFYGCTFVKEKFINHSSLDAEANYYWGATIADVEIDGLYIRNDTVVYCRRNVVAITIPDSITTIGKEAFSNCDSLRSIIIPNSVNAIEDYAFKSCASLLSITIPNGVTSIGKRAFYHCEALQSVALPNRLTSIGEWAFADCDSLISITIPNSVTSIGDYAFITCDLLDSIYCYAIVPPTINYTVFSYEETYYPTLYVPCDALEDYQAHSIWGRFANIDCIASEDVETQETVVNPSTNEVTITWPIEANAATYTIVIQSGDEVICTLRFNAQGQLLTIAYAPGREGNHPAQYAEQTAKGFRFTVTGLEQGTHYTYDITVQDANNHTILSHTGEFTTESMTAVDDITTNDKNTQKLLRDNQLLILHDGKTYNVMGMEVMKLR